MADKLSDLAKVDTQKLNDVKEKASDLLDSTSSRLDSDLQALREDITKLTASVTNLVTNQAATARSTVLGVVGDAQDRAMDTAADARNRVNAATADFEAAIERNPLLAVAAALVAGLFVGVLSRPRR